ncbi:MAG: exonuclease domain-containing protein [Arcanobacterium sp.]|nr:exonuclease domain-containing protein [Arcanobacterium sp.]
MNQLLWTKSPMLGFDTETTGINPLEDRIVTVSVVEVRPADDGRTELVKNYWLADPGVEIPQRATDVHGISTEQARAEGRPITEVLQEVSDLLVKYAEQELPIIAFNASYDLTLIEAELARHGLPTIAQRLGREVSPVIDPYMLDKSFDKWRKGKRNLETVAQHYGVWDDDAFHNAEADVLATLRVLGAMIRKFPEIAFADFSELMEAQHEAYMDSANYFINKALQEGRKYESPVGWPIAKILE